MVQVTHIDSRSRTVTSPKRPSMPSSTFVEWVVSVHYHKPHEWCVTVLHDGMSASYRRKHDTSTEGFPTRDEAAELATEIVMDLFAPV